MDKNILILTFLIFVILYLRNKNQNIEGFGAVGLDKCIINDENIHLEHQYIKAKCIKVNYQDDKDVYNCNRLDLDHHIVQLNNNFNKLKCLEYSGIGTLEEKYNYSRDIFISLYKKFYKEKKYGDNSLVIYQEFMKDLYIRNVYYYPVFNKLNCRNKIPIYNYVKNHNCIIPLLQRKIKAPLLHFDTHPDHSDFAHYDEYTELLKQPKLDYKKILELTFDIACFSILYFYYSKKDFIWITGDWVLEGKDFSIQDIVVKRIEGNRGEFFDVKKKTKDSMKFINGSLKCGFEIFTKHLNEDFVLSVDLDYFCSNGSLDVDEDDDVDYGSFDRTRYMTEFESPYYYFSKNSGPVYKKYLLNVKKEYKLINNRFRRFKFFLLNIKNNKNLKPKIVVLCDSSTVNISKDPNSISLTNDFTPQHIILYIRHKFYQVIEEVYGSNQKFTEFPKI